MRLSEISIKRPVLASMMSLGLVLFGVIGLSRLPVRELPDIDPPIVNVTTVYAGASAGVVEAQVTEILEESLASIEGIRTLTSESRQQVSSITIEFDLSRDIDVAAQDVRDRVSRVRGRLPKDIEEPIVAKQDANAQPVMWVALFSDRYSTLELTAIAEETIKDRLQTINGVSSIILGGAKRFAIRIWLDAQKMAARGITVLDVEQALKKQSVELPSGLVENRDRVLSIETRGELKTPREYNDLVIKQDGSTFVRLSDIGFAVVGVEDEKAIARFNSKPCIGIGVVKQSKANTIDVTRRVKKEITEIRSILPQGIEVAFPYDESVYVERAIKEVWETLFLAFGLVVLSIYIFLHDTRSTLVPTLTIPVSIIATFGVLYVMGYSVNIVSMLAFVLAIGLVVDDSIIVLENIYRHIEEGMKPLDAAIKGMKEIGFVVIATTVALVAVFLPLAFQTSVTGRLFIEFAVALSMSVVISAFVALTLSPMLSSRILKPVGHAKGGLLGHFERFLSQTTARYGRALKWSLDHPVPVTAVALATLVFSVFFYTRLQKEFMPDEDKGRLLCFALAPEGSTSEYTDRMMRKMEEIIAKVPEVEGYFSAVALARGSPGQTSQGLAFLRLKDERKRHLRDIIGGPTGLGAQFFNNVEGAFVIPIVPKSIGRGFSQPFQLVVQSQDLLALSKYAEELTNKLRSSGALLNVRTTFELNKPELRVNINRDRAAAVGVNVDDISRTMQILFGGVDLSKVKVKGKEYDVIVQLERASRLTPSDLEKIYIRNNRGELIQLNNVINYETGAGPSSINHYNRWRSATIEGTPIGIPLGTVMEKTAAVMKEGLPDGFRYEWTGDARDLIESSSQIYFVMILAAIVIYMVLAAQFESLIHPLTVMLTIPLAAFGAFGGLWLMSLISAAGWFGVIQGMSLNLYSQIGMILLFGIVTKNAILLVDFANQGMAEGKPAKEAMHQAGLIRLRPILMTAVATVVGILPIAIGFGASGEARRPLGVAAVFGMTTSTFLTLFVIPVAYVFFSKLTQGRPRNPIPPKAIAQVIVFVLAAAMLSGCVTGTNYQKPSPAYDASWKNPTETVPNFVMPEKWWELFDDQTLDHLEDLARENNQDMVIAMANVDKARALARVERADLWPQAELNPSPERSRSSGNASTFSQPSRITNSYKIPVDLGYEVDIWGRVRRAFAAGRAEAQAEAAAYGTVFLTLTADVAQNYFAIGAIDAQIEALAGAVDLRQKAVDMLKLRLEHGINSELTYYQAQTQLSQAQADWVDARRRRENLVNALAVLCGQRASDFTLPVVPLKTAVPQIPAGIPSQVLQNRPDILEAERSIAAASERLGIAKAAYFPSVTLTGSAGYASIDAGNLLDWESRVWSVGPSVSMPIFSGGRLKAEELAQQVTYEKTLAGYKKRVLIAFSEVENALADIRMRREQYGAQEELLRSAARAAGISIQRYKEGLVTFLEVIDAERSRLEAQRDAIQIQSEVLISTVHLIKALGGNWPKL
ncbi:MAG: efflux transporter outer membrane subunit [Candidatus Omnitrophica bacterium]|nr:efflux transporter outer membrane subunit [Candidatus Omnitrophota bacterium]